MDSSTQDRNLPASEQRLRKAREDGQVPRSRDLIHLVVLGGGLFLLSLLAPWGYERLRAAMQAQFRFTRAALEHPQHMQRVLSDTTAEGLMFFLPLGGVLLLAIVLAAVATGTFTVQVTVTDDMGKQAVASWRGTVSPAGTVSAAPAGGGGGGGGATGALELTGLALLLLAMAGRGARRLKLRTLR